VADARARPDDDASEALTSVLRDSTPTSLVAPRIAIDLFNTLGKSHLALAPNVDRFEEGAS